MGHRIRISLTLIDNVNLDSKMVFILQQAACENSTVPLGIVSLNFCQASVFEMALICGLNLHFPND